MRLTTERSKTQSATEWIHLKVGKMGFKEKVKRKEIESRRGKVKKKDGETREHRGMHHAEVATQTSVKKTA